MKRVAVVGCSGSGKSTFARALGERLGVPVHHLDRSFWRPGWREAPREEFLAAHDAAIAEHAWVIDGNYTLCIEPRLARADTIVFLDRPTWRNLAGVVRRRLEGKPRPDIAEDCPERLAPDFLVYVLTWNVRRRRRMRRRLAAASHARVVTLRTWDEAAAFVEGAT